mmetsp:Transcript_52612/g.104418  ORF Transcript_52612/g.104418 Transcript_52612/m.104418 type:complete len:200 (-) Transcript_52612:1123-1722(-)
MLVHPNEALQVAEGKGGASVCASVQSEERNAVSKKGFKAHHALLNHRWLAVGGDDFLREGEFGGGRPDVVECVVQCGEVSVALRAQPPLSALHVLHAKHVHHRVGVFSESVHDANADRLPKPFGAKEDLVDGAPQRGEERSVADGGRTRVSGRVQGSEQVQSPVRLFLPSHDAEDGSDHQKPRRFRITGNGGGGAVRCV